MREAYSARAEEYTSLLGSMDAVHGEDRRLLSGWAAALEGRIVDAGCGPGHWTAFLAGCGADIEGVDLTPAFVDLAGARHPSVRFRVAGVDALGVPDGSLAGILAWYSLIHLEPPRLEAALAEFARALGPHGGLVVGFVRGDRLEPFDHAVTTGYRWPLETMSTRLERAGFAVEEVHIRDEPGKRPHAALVTRRRSR